MKFHIVLFSLCKKTAAFLPPFIHWRKTTHKCLATGEKSEAIPIDFKAAYLQMVLQGGITSIKSISIIYLNHNLVQYYRLLCAREKQHEFYWGSNPISCCWWSYTYMVYILMYEHPWCMHNRLHYKSTGRGKSAISTASGQPVCLVTTTMQCWYILAIGTTKLDENMGGISEGWERVGKCHIQNSFQMKGMSQTSVNHCTNTGAGVGVTSIKKWEGKNNKNTVHFPTVEYRKQMTPCSSS